MRLRSTAFLLSSIVSSVAGFVACGVDGAADATEAPAQPANVNGPGTTPPTGDAPTPPPGAPDASSPSLPPDTPFFATATIEDRATVSTQSDGDLWPSCWSDDDALYTANGDGDAFGGTDGRADQRAVNEACIKATLYGSHVDIV